MPLSSIIFYILIILCDIIGLVTTIAYFTLLWRRRSIVRTDWISYLLISNSYIAFLVVCPLFIDIAVRAIYGHLHPESDFSGWTCLMKSYVFQMTGCAYFHSFLLQAIYRFFRIIYPCWAICQSLHVYVALSIGIWIIAAIIVAPSFALGFLRYLPTEYYCQYPLTDFRASMVGLSGLFIFPFTATLVIYFITLHHVRKKTKALATLQQKLNIRRDLMILSRLVILFVFVSTVGVPHVIFTVIHATTGYFPPWGTACTWFFTLLSFSIASMIQLLLSSHLRKLWTIQPGTPGIVKEICSLELRLETH